MDFPEYMPACGSMKGLSQKLKIIVENNKVLGIDTLGNKYIAVVYSPNGSFISSVVNFKNRYGEGISNDLIYQLMTDARLVKLAYQHSVRNDINNTDGNFISEHHIIEGKDKY
jgi:hypothetical protein